MARFHSFWFVLFVVVFIATGMYMTAVFPEAYQGDETMRMLFRSAHVYILLGAFMNGTFAINLRVPAGQRNWLFWFGSACIALTPVIFTLAFFFEPAPDRLDRPISLAGIVVGFTGIVAAMLASRAQPDS